MAQIGLKDVHYALLVTDTLGDGVSYGSSVAIAGAITANINANTSSSTLFADDGPSIVSTTLGEIELELNMSDLPIDVQAALLGHSAPTAGILERSADSVPPWVAIGFRSLKSTGKYKYVWLLKGKFQEPEMKFETKGESITYTTPTIKGKFVKREYDQLWMREGDEDDASFVTGATFLNAVEAGAGASALTCTVAPIDGASGQATSVNVTWTYNNAIDSSYATEDFFTLTKADGTAVAGAYSIDTDHKVVTFNPTSALDGASTYIAIASGAVKDVYGQTVAGGNTVTNFATS